MKFIPTVVGMLVGASSVHAFHLAVPGGLTLRQVGVQRSRRLSMAEKAAPAAKTAPAPAKKRSINVQFVQETPGGYITVVEVNNFKGVTHHRIVVGKHQVEHYTKLAGKEVAVDDLVTYVVKYMMDKGMSLDNTEGMIDSSVFPVNYFTLKQLSYYHDDVDEKVTALCKEAPDLSEL